MVRGGRRGEDSVLRSETQSEENIFKSKIREERSLEIKRLSKFKNDKMTCQRLFCAAHPAESSL